MAVPAGRLAPVPRRRAPVRRAPVHRPRPATRRRPQPKNVPAVRRVPFALVVLLFLAPVVVGLVVAQTMVAQDSFRVAELTRTAERLEEEYGRLRVKAAELSSPDRIVAAAKKAGLVLPEQVELVRLPPVRRGTTSKEGSGQQTFALKGVLGGSP